MSMPQHQGPPPQARHPQNQEKEVEKGGQGGGK
jgi:hypothetical protein